MILGINNLAKKFLPGRIHMQLMGRWSEEGLYRYMTNTLWPLITRSISLIVSFSVTIYLVRYLGPENYGQLSYAVSFVGLFSIVASFGIDHILYRDLIAHPENRNEYLGSAFVLKLLAGSIAAALTIGSTFIFSHDDVSRLIILMLSITFVFSSFNLINYEFQANVAQKYVSIINLIVVFALGVLKLIVIFLEQGILYIGAILLFEAVLYSSLLIYARTKLYGSLFNWRFDRTTARQLAIDSWPFIFIAAFATIYTRVDQVMLKHFLDATAVGLYDAAVRISEVWIFFPAIFISSLFPAIINAKKTDLGEYKKRLLLLIALVTVVSTLIAGVMTILAAPIISLLYGTDYTASTPVLLIYVWSGVFTVVGIAVQHFLTAENLRKTLFFSSAGAMAVNVGLNLVLIPEYGIIGAAWSTLISYSILTLPILIIFKISAK